MSVTTHSKPGRLLRDARINRGLSPEDLSYAIFQAGLGTVSGKTIRRIEARDGFVPRVRVQFAIAQYLGLPVTSIWKPAARSRTEAAA